MKEDKFIKENSANWNTLENLLKNIKSNGLKSFDKDNLDNLFLLYNKACGHLSYSRTYYGNSNTTAYLNKLVSSAHSYIYTSNTSNFKKLSDFFKRHFPMIFSKNIKFFIISFSLFMIGFIISFILTLINPDNLSAFFPGQLAEKAGGNWDSPLMSSIIMTNNIKVGLYGFALGITLGIGTCYILISNGFILGSIAAMFIHKGTSFNFWALILPHGILELFAIFICGAAGLIIGYSLINPGSYSRKDSFVLRGKVAVKLVCATIPMFIIAGLIEGFFTPMNIHGAFKYLFALITLVLIVCYLVFTNKKTNKKEL